jgi:hypothetical protein
MGEKMFTTDGVFALKEERSYSLIFENKLKLVLRTSDLMEQGWNCGVEFENISNDTVSISNVIPFNSDNESVNIMGKGPWDLARRAFPAKVPSGQGNTAQQCPGDGYSFEANNGFSVCAMARRQQIEGGQRQRYETILPPKAKVFYGIYQMFLKVIGRTD